MHLILLFEQGLGHEDAHISIFTELVILYTMHVLVKVMEHCKVFFTKLNISKVIKACEHACIWSATVYLYVANKQYDSAIKVMMEWANTFSHELFLDSIIKVHNNEVIYKAIGFYLTTYPTPLLGC